MHGKILTIAGSDPCGGAGIQADIKTISALGGYAMAVITALTVQNTRQVYEVHPVDAELVAAQVRAVLDDITPDAIKVGMMGSAEIALQLAKIFEQHKEIPLILDPVILSTSGHSLLEDKGVDILTSEIFPHLDLVTPNLREAAFLTGSDPIDTIEDMIRAAEKLRAMGPMAVLVKGGHLTGDILTDILVTGNGVREFSSPKIATDNTHGTGCTLATAIAVGMGQGMDVNGAVLRGHDYVQKAIMKAPGYGCGKGPLNHLVVLD